MANPLETEILVIGSGFGGSIAAHRLVEAGHQVVMLERGPWRDTAPVRSIGIANRSPLPQGWRLFSHGFRSIHAPGFRKTPLGVNVRGFFEAFFGNGIWFFCTSNVGGGSHAYAALHDRPLKQNFWDGYHPDISSAKMEPYYAALISQFGSRPVTPADQVPNHMSLSGGGTPGLDGQGLPDPCVGVLLPQRPGVPRTVVDENGVERTECAMDNNSFLGSPAGAKTTLDFKFLWPAIKKGLRVHDMCEVKSIMRLAANDSAFARYDVHCRDHNKGRDVHFIARHVILAAGGVNTVRLLLHSRDVTRGLGAMPQLGKKVGGNGDFFGFWRENSPTDLTKGLPVGGGFRAEGSRYPDAYLVRAGLQGLKDYPLPGSLKTWLRHQSIIIALGKDLANGHIALDGKRLSIVYNRATNPGYDEIDGWISEVEAATQTSVYAFKTPISVHPTGGACLGSSADSGVVDANGEVFGHPGLYVADAAALPAAPGGPPSMTISTWAANVADRLIEREAQETTKSLKVVGY